MLPQKIQATDGYALAATLIAAQGQDRKQAILINSAMGVKQKYYGDYATFLASRGFTVLTYDYRGIGGSKPGSLRGFKAGYLDWAKHDQTGAICWLKQHYPDHELLVVGHSLGGQIAGLTPEYASVSRWLNVASQSGYWQLWDGIGKAQMWMIWHVMIPASVALVGYLPGRRLGMGNDIPTGVALDWARGGRHPRYILDLYAGTQDDHYPQVTAPMKFLSFSDDTYAPRRAVDALLTFYPNAPKSHDHITPSSIGVHKIGHFGFFNKKFADTLWLQSANWLENR